MLAEPGWTWAQAVPWLLTAAGTTASLGWNYFNYTRTTRIQRQLREDTIRLDEFRRVRTLIDGILAEIRNEQATWHSVASGGTSVEELRRQIEGLQAKILLLYMRLDSALTRANESDFATGEDWLALLEQPWDDYNSAVNRVFNPQHRETEIRIAIRDAAKHLGKLIAAVESRIDRETKQYMAPA
jgi:hypothetical protein